MPYPGGKNGSGVYQAIINQLPPHRVYIEPFVGGGAVLRNKWPAQVSAIVDADAEVAATWQAQCNYIESGWRIKLGVPWDDYNKGVLIVSHADALDFLKHFAFSNRGDELVYLDPPYLLETRSSKRPIYAHEFGSEHDHIALIDVVRSLPCMVALSGYWSELYAERLADWRYVSYNAVNRRGRVVREFLWMNYPQPLELHDYRYLGSTFRERERIKRRQRRWTHRLLRMPKLERYAILAAMEDLGSTNAEIDDAGKKGKG